LVRALLIGTASVGIVVPATVASAAPSPADLQKQIDDVSNNLEKIVEQYNRVTEDLKATAAAQAALASQMAPLQASMDAAYSAVQDIAVKAYKGAPMSTGMALLQAGSPTDLLEQLGTLDELGRQRRTEISGYEQAKSKYDGQKKQLDDGASRGVACVGHAATGRVVVTGARGAGLSQGLSGGAELGAAPRAAPLPHTDVSAARRPGHRAPPVGSDGLAGADALGMCRPPSASG